MTAPLYQIINRIEEDHRAPIYCISFHEHPSYCDIFASVGSNRVSSLEYTCVPHFHHPMCHIHHVLFEQQELVLSLFAFAPVQETVGACKAQPIPIQAITSISVLISATGKISCEHMCIHASRKAGRQASSQTHSIHSIIQTSTIADTAFLHTYPPAHTNMRRDFTLNISKGRDNYFCVF